MLNKFLFCLFFLVYFEQPIVDGSTIKFNNEHTKNSHNAECPNLAPELIKEIQSYQPIVNQIVSAVVNGQYSGDTWNA